MLCLYVWAVFCIWKYVLKTVLKLQAWMVASTEGVQEEGILGMKERIKFSSNREMVIFSNSSLVSSLAGIWKESEEKDLGGGEGEEEPQICWKMGFPNTLTGMLTFPTPHFLFYLIITVNKMCLATSHMRWSSKMSLSWGLTRGDSLSEQKQSFQHCWRRDSLGAVSFWWQSRSNSEREIWESLP